MRLTERGPPTSGDLGWELYKCFGEINPLILENLFDHVVPSY